MEQFFEAAANMGRGGKKGKNLNELKQELEIDVHRVKVFFRLKI